MTTEIDREQVSDQRQEMSGEQMDQLKSASPDTIFNEKGKAVYTFEKFSKEQWGSIERLVDETTGSILKLLIEAGSGAEWGKFLISKLKACGETAYLNFVRPKLIQAGFMSKTAATVAAATDKKDKKQQVNKTDQIRLENFNRIMDKETSELFELLGKSREKSVEYGLNRNIVELRLVSLYALAHLCLTRSESDQEAVYKTIQTIQLVLENIKKYNFTSTINPSQETPVSETLVKDLQTINE